MRFGDAAELGLPVAVADHPVDVAAARVGLPARLLRGGEIDVARRAGRVVGIEDRLDRTLAGQRRGDRRLDPLAGHVGDLLVQQLGRIGAAGAAQIAAVQPLPGDAFSWPNRCSFGSSPGSRNFW